MNKLTSGLSLGKMLGAGHFGEVYEATDPVHGRVAVKKLKRDPVLTDEEWVKRRVELLHEGKMLAAATHDNVVRVIQILEPEDDAESLHLVLEFCDGGSLGSEYRAGPSPCDRVREIATDVARGLDAMHARHMLHRDIKPDNILLVAGGRSKIGDFGLVTDNLVFGYASSNGYADHLATEVWAGQGTSVKTDVWALGMTIYRMLHGHQWYGLFKPSRQSAADGTLAKDLVWLPHIPDRWRRLIRKALHPDPVSRYQSMSQVLSAIAKVEVDGAWQCKISSGGVSWNRSYSGRRQLARWLWQSATSTTWDAMSLPPAGVSGNSRKLGSGTAKTVIDALKQLDSFFEKAG